MIPSVRNRATPSGKSPESTPVWTSIPAIPRAVFSSKSEFSLIPIAEKIIPPINGIETRNPTKLRIRSSIM
ncbi:MAG: hypothetical protein R2744_12950 [Bacteroidales bacterium]